MFQFAHKAIQPFLLLKQQRFMHICATIRVKIFEKFIKFFCVYKDCSGNRDTDFVWDEYDLIRLNIAVSML